MAALSSISVILMFLFAGMILAKLKFVPGGKTVELLVNLSLFSLLFFMGFRIGRNEEIGRALKQIGIVSITFALATVAGTIIVLAVMYHFQNMFLRKKSSVPESSAPDTDCKKESRKKKESLSGLKSTYDTEEEKNTKTLKSVTNAFLEHFREPAKLVAFVLAGFSAGFFINALPQFTGENITSWLLNTLLFMIGIQLVNNNVTLKEALAHPDTILIPAGTIIGSLLGGLAVSGLLSITPGKALALSAGFGWYSLSGVIITDMGDPVLGSAGFLINIMRETIALLTIPFLSTTRFPNIGIGVAGATSMDVTLPLIEKSCGDKVVPLSITSGAILSLIVPILVPVFYQLG